MSARPPWNVNNVPHLLQLVTATMGGFIIMPTETSCPAILCPPMSRQSVDALLECTMKALSAYNLCYFTSCGSLPMPF